MKAIITTNEELINVLEENGITITCNEEMDIIVSDEDASRIDEIVKEFAPAAIMDYEIEERNTYDVVFNDDCNSNRKGINGTYEECMDWIHCNRRDKSTYFGDYAGGTVSIVCNETEEEVYSESII